jgi:DNA-binding CsgD family transcriptional regulator
MTPADAWALLTGREQEVVRAIVKHHGSSKAAAHELGIARHTVRNHRTNIMAKLNVGSTLEAFAVLGIVRTPPGKS